MYTTLPRTLYLSLLQYHRSQYWNRGTIGAYQDKMLCRLISHAAVHVPYYRRLFVDIGLNPATFRGRRDMGKIPFLEKETFRLNTRDFMADNADRYSPTWSQTSGSTGTPLSYILDAGALAHDAAAALRSYGWAGYYPGMKLFSVKDYLKKWEFRYSQLGRVLNFDLNSINQDSGLRIWKEINKLKPTVFRSYPFTLMMLYQYGTQAGVDMHFPRRIITTGETLSRDLRQRLESRFHAEIFDYYGMTENASMITECPCHSYHVIEDVSFHEFCDPGTGHPIHDGRGEIIATNFYNYAMPLIRYRTGDFARLHPPSHTCPCGRNFRTVKTIEGRKEDYIETPEGTRLNLIETPLNHGKGIMMGQYVQDRPDHMYVNIVPGPDFVKSSLVAVETDLRRLLNNSSIAIEFHLVDQLEYRGKNKTGKIPFIYSKTGKSFYQ